MGSRFNRVGSEFISFMPSISKALKCLLVYGNTANTVSLF